MNNITLLKEILCSKSCYWVVSKPVTVRNMGRDEKRGDQIIVISIPEGHKREQKDEEILLCDIERLSNSSCECNIFLNEDYGPFQLGIRFKEFSYGFPIDKCNFREFMKQAICLNSNNISDYKKLIK